MLAPLRMRVVNKLTRSSPIGPAEHDEGGSLYSNHQHVGSALQAAKRGLSVGKRIRAAFWQPETCSAEFLPAEVCQFFVDTFESHLEIL